jgi:hypothetical protein
MSRHKIGQPAKWLHPHIDLLLGFLSIYWQAYNATFSNIWNNYVDSLTYALKLLNLLFLQIVSNFMPPNGGIVPCKPKSNIWSTVKNDLIFTLKVYYNDIYCALKILLCTPYTEAFPAPCMYSWKSSLQRYIKCLICVARNVSHKGFSDTSYVWLVMPTIKTFLVSYMCCRKCTLQGHFQCFVSVARNTPYRGILNALHV